MFRQPHNIGKGQMVEASLILVLSGLVAKTIVVLLDGDEDGDEDGASEGRYSGRGRPVSISVLAGSSRGGQSTMKD